MKGTRRYLPSPAMLVALLALFVALGGAAYAGVKLGTNTVRSATIKNGEVKTADLASSAVTNSKVKKSAIDSARVKDGSLRDADISGLAAAKITGKVASAAAADTATSAANAVNAANADKLDTLDSTAFQLKARWALVASTGTIISQSGGISVVGTTGSGGYYLDFGAPLTGKGIVATIRYHQAGPSLRGQVAASICGFVGGTETDAVACGGSGTNDANHLWVITDDGTGTQTPRDFYVAVLP
jgi:hypothetical protein